MYLKKINNNFVELNYQFSLNEINNGVANGRAMFSERLLGVELSKVKGQCEMV